MGAITVAAAGVRKSAEGGLIGAILAAGGTLFSSHYGLEVQAANYEKAAQAMLCLQNKLGEVSDETIDTFFDERGSFRDMGGAPELRKIAAVPHQANGAIQRIVDKLRSAQASVKLSTPEPSAITPAWPRCRRASWRSSMRSRSSSTSAQVSCDREQPSEGKPSVVAP